MLRRRWRTFRENYTTWSHREFRWSSNTRTRRAVKMDSWTNYKIRCLSCLTYTYIYVYVYVCVIWDPLLESGVYFFYCTNKCWAEENSVKTLENISYPIDTNLLQIWTLCNKCINIAVVIIIIIIIVFILFYRTTVKLQYWHLWMLMELLFWRRPAGSPQCCFLTTPADL